MGVSFYACKACGDTFTTCGPFGSCELCGEMFCERCYPNTVHEDDFITKGPQGENETDVKGLEMARMEACPLCSEEVITDEMLVSFLLKKLKWTRKKAEKEYRKK